MAVVMAQGLISGKVTDSSGRPLPQSNVYVNGSTLGTVSGADGSFSLQVGKIGFVELVVSHIGFDPLVYRIEMPVRKRFVFQLQPKEQLMRNVVVLSVSQRKKWMELFKEHFLGITHAGKTARILNESDIAFASGPDGSILAHSDEPLVVINKELGYRIHFQLVAFSYSNERTSFIGFSRFEELGPNTARTKARTRQKYYEGSSMHFFRSVINHQLDVAGFDLRLLQQSQAPASMIDTTRGKAAIPATARASRAAVVYSVPVIADSLVHRLDGGSSITQYQLQWKGRLQVQFNKDPYTKYYLQKQVLLQGGRPKGVVAYIDIQEPPVLIDGQGALANPLSVAYSGYWIYEKLGSMLPADYGLN